MASSQSSPRYDSITLSSLESQITSLGVQLQQLDTQNIDVAQGPIQSVEELNDRLTFTNDIIHAFNPAYHQLVRCFKAVSQAQENADKLVAESVHRLEEANRKFEDAGRQLEEAQDLCNHAAEVVSQHESHTAEIAKIRDTVHTFCANHDVNVAAANVGMNDTLAVIKELCQDEISGLKRTMQDSNMRLSNFIDCRTKRIESAVSAGFAGVQTAMQSEITALGTLQISNDTNATAVAALKSALEQTNAKRAAAPISPLSERSDKRQRLSDQSPIQIRDSALPPAQSHRERSASIRESSESARTSFAKLSGGTGGLAITRNELLESLDAWHPTASNNRIPAAQLPASIRQRLQRHLDPLLYVDSQKELSRKISREGAQCLRAKCGKYKSKATNDVEACSDCKARGTCCIRGEKSETRHLIVPMNVIEMVDEEHWERDDLWCV